MNDIISILNSNSIFRYSLSIGELGVKINLVHDPKEEYNDNNKIIINYNPLCENLTIGFNQLCNITEEGFVCLNDIFCKLCDCKKVLNELCVGCSLIERGNYLGE